MVVNFSYSQNRELKKKIKLKQEEVNYYYQYDNYHLALPVLEELYQLDSSNTETTYKLAICIYKTKRDKQESYRFFEKSKNDFIDSWYYLGILNHDKMLFDDALDIFRKYKNINKPKSFSDEDIDYYMSKSLNAKDMIKSKINLNIQNLGDKINTKYPDYSPLILSDESVLFFTSRREGKLKDPLGEYYEDIYMSKNVNNKWSEPINLGRPVNTDLHDASVTISADGMDLYIYRTNTDLLGGDIYLSKWQDTVWSNPEKIKADINFKNSWTPSATIAPDNNTIYFSSDRVGGFGGKDIYRVTKMPDGTWSLAENLGSSVNTPFDDDAPFIHHDGKTLYFSSKGHKGMGGFDVFVTEKNIDGAWTSPENLGFPINSVRDDIYYVVTSNGKKAYFSSNREGGYGNSDIYTVDLLDNPSNYILLKGTVTTNDPVFSNVKATISIIDYQSKELQGIYRTQAESGKYLLVLLPKRKYKMVVEAEGFYSIVDEVDLSVKLRIEDLFKNIVLQREKIKEETEIIINE